MKTIYLLCCCLASFGKVPAADAPSNPNILFILTDDRGWPTLGCYGNKLVPTPHLDSLAHEGIRFTSAYVMPQCTPTRAALLTGQHTARNHMWHVIPWYGTPWAPVREPWLFLSGREDSEDGPERRWVLRPGLFAVALATDLSSSILKPPAHAAQTP